MFFCQIFPFDHITSTPFHFGNPTATTQVTSSSVPAALSRSLSSPLSSPPTSPPSRPRFNFSFDSVVQNLSGLPLLNTMNTWSEGNWCCFGGWLIKLLLTFRFLIDFYTLRHPVTCEILSTRIWGVPPACLGSR